VELVDAVGRDAKIASGYTTFPSPPSYRIIAYRIIAPRRRRLTYPKYMDTGLRDRVAIVAASSQGIGRATAIGFAAEGTHLALCARNLEGLEQVAAEARERFGVEVLTAKVDVAEDEAVRQFVRSVEARFGRIDICVTNAGGPPAKLFLDTTMEEWDRAYQLNLRSVVSFAQAVLPFMQGRKWGRLVTITSITVKQPVLNLVLSNAIRTGVVGLVRSLAEQFGGDGITVNNVGPGFTATERMKELAGKQAQGSGRSQEEALQTFVKDVPLGRMAKPEEVADAIVWLASERASYITGQTLLVDGGAYRGL
jgi:3-oxoacyl-[acyl-carrier protein] reductase